MYIGDDLFECCCGIGDYVGVVGVVFGCVGDYVFECDLFVGGL